MRDDCIALFVDSGLTQKQVHERGGPTPGTISKWLYGETLFPRLSTIISFSIALGARVQIVSTHTPEQSRDLRLALPVGAATRKPTMPKKGKRR
jgi:transcriptional regulator with XRE-family HTH domain